MANLSQIPLNPIAEVRGFADGCHSFRLEGDLAYTLVLLKQAGQRGCEPSHLVADLGRYVGKLRGYGIAIDTVRTKDLAEPRFRTRYMLRSRITLADVELAEEFRHA